MVERARRTAGRSRGGSRQLTDLSDEALMILVGSRRADAFEELYRRHAGAVSALVGRICSDRQVADEVTQTAFMTLWNNAARFRPEAGRLRAWLLTIARNTAIDRARVKRVEIVPFESAPMPVSQDLGPAELVANRERDREVREALGVLSLEQRTVIELAFFGGLTQIEIAGVIGEPLGTVKSRVRLGMQKLRRLLGPIQGNLS
jgi:RNA polymerase sigma-70 factor (ECF subfamily)